MTITTSILAAVAATLAFSAGVQASDDSRPVREVYVGDLNLLNEAGRAEMQRRVKSAAHRVCNVNQAAWAEKHRCRKEAIAGAASQMANAIALAELRAQTRLASR